MLTGSGHLRTAGWLAAVMIALAMAGCQSNPKPLAATTRPVLPSTGLDAPAPLEPVDALCTPPEGWRIEPLKSSAKHAHQVWLSPSGKTAYGVIRMTLPLPVGSDLVLWAFMREMKKSEGEATLLSKEKDPELPGIRFVAEGGLYKMRTNLLVHGRRAWAVYAGTLRSETEMPEELEMAERAREHTVVDLEAQSADQVASPE